MIGYLIQELILAIEFKSTNYLIAICCNNQYCTHY